MRCLLTAGLVLLLVRPLALLGADDLTTWTKPADLTASVTKAEATLTGPPKLAFLRSGGTFKDPLLRCTLTIHEPARSFGFFGSSWSVWPDPTYPDQGYEAAVLLRAGPSSGYRVQLSHRYQDLAVVKYPDGGYLAVVPCQVEKGRAHKLAIGADGPDLSITLDDNPSVLLHDRLLPLTEGQVGVGASSGAKVSFRDVEVSEGFALGKRPTLRRPGDFRVRNWLGGRPWVFDGAEPVLLLPVPEANSINNVKLRPGYKPQLSWNSHWDISNQGAYPPGASTNSPVKVEREGSPLVVSWTTRQKEGRFQTRTRLSVTYDQRRDAYVYATDSDLEVLGKEPFTFRYGYDFEHHTPLDPFRWQYLLVRREGSPTPERRPVYPIDPGVMSGVEQKDGLRLWYGRHNDKLLVAPAVEYDIPDPGKRKLSTAVCAAFYDTGVSFAPETAKPGTVVRVRYRYTGYPAAEAEALFRSSKLHESPMLDPERHYIFAEEWPTLTFKHFVPLGETWIYGRRPFLTGHNVRPTYELARDTGVGAGFGMKLGPGAFARAALPVPADLAPGRYALVARCRSDNAHGPGGRIELTVTAPKGGKELTKHVHHVGRGSFDWKTTGFVFEVPQKGCGLTLGLGNAGTGEVVVGEVSFRALKEGEELPAGVQERPAPAPAISPSPAGALSDYRMEEQKGLFVLDSAGGIGTLELSNVGWAVEDGRPALKFADNTEGKKSYPRNGNLQRNYLAHPGYAGRDVVPVALAGHHGGGQVLKAFTLAAWVKPAATMGKAEHGGKGDVVGLGGRRVILRLVGQSAPYQLSAALNVNDVFTAPVKLEAGRWYHVAVTGEPTAERKWKVRLYVDGKLAHEGTSVKMEAPVSVPPSLVLGAEIFYFHDAYYRGLIGRVLVFGRALGEGEVAELAREKGTP